MAALIVGVGMTPFRKPGQSDDYVAMARRAILDALTDAGLSYEDIQQAYAGWVHGDSTCGQRAAYSIGMTGIPIFNVNNNCATGSSALFLARQAVESGAVDYALAFGFEQMLPGALDEHYKDRPSPLAPFLEVADRLYPEAAAVPLAIRLFGAAGEQFQERLDLPPTLYAHIRAKASRHAVHNERAIFRSVLSVEDVMEAPTIFRSMTRLQACPPSCGAAAAVVCSESAARRRGLLSRAIVIRAQSMTTDEPSSLQGDDMTVVVGAEMARRAARAVFERSGVAPEDLDVVEMHDCFAPNEAISYVALGLCAPEDLAPFVLEGRNTYGGGVVTNPSGGLLSKGHPLGATGLAQCAELVWQLRGEAGSRQVPEARLALQHNLGLGGACVVTLYERPVKELGR